jgi:hypothetical protein
LLCGFVPSCEIDLVTCSPYDIFGNFVARILFMKKENSRMRQFTYTIFLLTLFFSCQEKEKETKGILTKAELSAFLIEMYLAEARIDNLSIVKDSAIKLFLPYEEKLMKKFNLADSTLKKTYQYYIDHPKEMEMVYDALIDTLNLREQRAK